MFDDFLLVNKKILPANYEKVIEAKSLLDSNKVKSVQEAVDKIGISRSTYYKYKDYIFKPADDFGQRFRIAIKAQDKPGVLSDILKVISSSKASVVTIHQDIPINHNALITVTLDAGKLETDIDKFLDTIKKIKFVNQVELTSFE